MSYVVTGVRNMYVYFLWYKAFMHFYLWLYWFNNLVKHLKFNNMRLTRLLMNSYFMQVQKIQRNHYTKIEHFYKHG
jgi:hypothetical protein